MKHVYPVAYESSLAVGFFSPSQNRLLTRGIASWNSGATTHKLYTDLVAINGYLRNLCIELDNAPGTGKTLTFTVLKNGSATAVVATISGSNTTGNSGSLEVAVAEGDTVQLQVARSGGNLDFATRVRHTVEIEGDNYGEFTVGGTHNNAFLPTAASRYYGGIASAGSWDFGNVLLNSMIAPCDFTIEDLRVALNSAPGSGKSYTWSVFIDGVEQTSSQIVLSTTTSGSATGLGLSVTAGQRVVFSGIAAGTPASNTFLAHWAIKCIAANNGESFVVHQNWSSQGLSNSATEYGQLGHPSNISFGTTEADHECIGNTTPFDLYDMYIIGNTQPGASKSYDFTIRENAADSAITANLAGTNLTVQDLTHSITISSSDKFCIKSVPNSTPSAGTFAISLVQFIQPTDAFEDRNSIMAGGDGWYRERFGSTTKKDATETTATWAGDGVVVMTAD